MKLKDHHNFCLCVEKTHGSSKHSKCVVNQKLDYFDDISFRELFGGMRVWFFTHTKKKIYPFIQERLNIVVMKRKFKQ